MKKLLVLLPLALGACSGQAGFDLTNFVIQKGSEITTAAAQNVAKGVDTYCSIPASVRGRSWEEVNKYTQRYNFDPQCIAKLQQQVGPPPTAVVVRPVQ